MEWNKDKSLKLSRICVYIFAVIMVAAAIAAPKLFSLLISLRTKYLAGTLPYFLASTYTACIPATVALWGLNRLLGNIEKGDVFINENVHIMRTLSWRCIVAGLICFLSASYYMPFLILAAAAGFVGLILRVVKNVFARAVEIKQENDYTI
ncbi:MAG: DUF2975 domain-containing protein [Oscillospiraceae bacterium]|nr:DUF2975 domain-containing protein [Oscillospiraceae bacterium]